jgi:hypothetical protein
MSGGYELVGRADADASGAFTLSVPVPSWAEPNLVYYFFVNLGGGVRTLSDPFLVTTPEGALEITGTASAAAPGCVLIAGMDGTPYALLGVTDGIVAGMRVQVEGTLGPAEEVGPVGSRCGRPAIPVRVRSLRGG